MNINMSILIVLMLGVIAVGVLQISPGGRMVCGYLWLAFKYGYAIFAGLIAIAALVMIVLEPQDEDAFVFFLPTVPMVLFVGIRDWLKSRKT